MSPHSDVTDRRRVHILLPFELVVRLDRYRYEHQFASRSAAITEAVREYLDQRDNEGRKPRTLFGSYYSLTRPKPPDCCR